MFNKMDRDNNNYIVNSRRAFKPIATFKPKTIRKVFDFAYDMTFSGEGEHRVHRTGGSEQRKNGQIFADAFQGKLAECGFYNLMYNNKIPATEPDFQLFKLGKWDDEDINVKGKSISIKSTKSKGNLLLLEEKDWDNNATYIPNNKVYDYTFLLRLTPFCSQIMKNNKLLYSNEVEKEELFRIIGSKTWKYDIPGFISKDDLKIIINNDYTIKKDSKLNVNTDIDADNYYVQAGDLRSIDEFINELK